MKFVPSASVRGGCEKDSTEGLSDWVVLKRRRWTTRTSIKILEHGRANWPRTACRSGKSTRSIADVLSWHSNRVLHNRSTKQKFPHLRTGLADQFSFVNGGQFLDGRLHPARFRLVQAGKLDEQPARWIGTGVTRPRAGNVLCIAHGTSASPLVLVPPARGATGETWGQFYGDANAGTCNLTRKRVRIS
jgi:hypothetical protein